MDAQDIETDELIELLKLGTSDLYYHDAAVRLISAHRYWLDRRDFRRFVELFDQPRRCAGIWWEKAAAALDRGEMAADYEPANILRIAASIATFYPVSFRDVSERLSPESMRLAAEAMMHAGGYTQSAAKVRL